MATTTDSPSPSQFQGLIDNLREKAVEESEAEAKRIVSAAERRAADTLAKAKREAEAIVSEAEALAEKREAAGHDALKRASRDVLLSLEAAITGRLDAVLKRETRAVVRGEVLAAMVRALVEKWSPDAGDGKLEILLSQDDLEALKEAGWQGLQEELLDGVVLRPVPGVEAGLRIGRENGTIHYDFSAEILAEWMGRFVTPPIRELLRQAAGEVKPSS